MSPIPPDHPQLSESGVLRLDSAMPPEARYRALVQVLPDVVVVLFDRDLRVLSLEGGGIDRIPQRPSELVGRRLDQISQRIDEVEPHYRAALAGEQREFDFEAANGVTWWVIAIPMIDEHGETIGVMAQWRDVTARVAAEHEVEAYAREL